MPRHVLPSEVNEVITRLRSWMNRASPRYFSLFFLINTAAFYCYLFWDSFLPSGLALAGGSADILFLKNDRFMDWMNTLHSAGLAMPYGLEHQVAMPVYGPLTYLLLRPLADLASSLAQPSALPQVAWMVITLLVLLSVMTHLQMMRRCLYPERDPVSGSELGAAILVSYPFLFAFDRGNLEIITLGLVSWYVCRIVRATGSSKRQKPGEFVIDNLILAIATCIKPYCLIFGLLTLISTPKNLRRMAGSLAKSFSYVIGIALILSLISMLILYPSDPGQGIMEFSQWQARFKSVYIVGDAADIFFVSPFVAMKLALSRHVLAPWSVDMFVHLYPLAAFVVAASTLVATYRSPSFLGENKLILLLTVLGFILLIFPYTANEYKAIYLLLPFCLAYRSRPSSPEQTLLPATDRADGMALGLLQPECLCIGLCFVLLVNRYGFTGDKFVASMVASMVLLLFPLLLSRAYRYQRLDAHTG